MCFGYKFDVERKTREAGDTITVSWERGERLVWQAKETKQGRQGEWKMGSGEWGGARGVQLVKRFDTGKWSGGRRRDM